MQTRRGIGIAVILSWICIAPAKAATETELHSFGCTAHGGNPQAGVIVDEAGNLYGTASCGALGFGIVYRIDTAGNETVLHNFRGGTDGNYPYAGVIRDSAGNLYGTTVYGGTSGAGVVYKIDTSGQETVVYSFTGGADGGNPYAGVIRDSAGNLYGTTYHGGASGAGVVYKIDSAGQEKVVYSFTGGADGGNPYAGVIRDSAGNLYGTTYYGGSLNVGVVYKITAGGHETVLHSFASATDGAFPVAGLIRDSAGNLYGTTIYGGELGFIGYGTVYEIDAAGAETILFRFDYIPDGSTPYGGLVRDSAGNLYGTFTGGGNIGACAFGGCGGVFELDASGEYEQIYEFTSTQDGGTPLAGVSLDSAGNIYGTAYYGGAGSQQSGRGVVYKFVNEGNALQYTVAYTFPADTDQYPIISTHDSAGNLYGTTSYGGGGTGNGGAGYGTVFKLDGSGMETVLYTFTGGADGAFPVTGVARDSAGNLYGTTTNGGMASSLGVVFKLDTTGHETVLHAFTGGVDGEVPNGVILDSSGNVYGSTQNGGSSGAGVVYKIDTAGQQTVLHSFTGGLDGSNPWGVIRDAAGNLYGAADGGGASGYGVVFKINTAGQETVLYNFTGGTDGGYPMAGVIRDSAGNFYGTASLGSGNSGVVYKVDVSGQETVLYTFTGGTDGNGPAGLVRDSAGNLYGITSSGGVEDLGVVYQVTTSGQETVLYSFTSSMLDGYFPEGTLILDSTGNLYGATGSGGEGSGGVVFEVKP